MSRDPGPGGPDERDERAAELLTAYVDGVSELLPDERRRVEALLAGDGDARADQAMVRGLIDELRALPPEGSESGEPDWAAMERSIRDAVGREVPRPWWRRWTWLAPAATLATAMAVLLVLWSRLDTDERTPVLPRVAPPARPGDHEVAREDRDESRDKIVPLWLDGAEVDVDVSASAMLGDALPGAAAQAPPDDEEAAPELGDPDLALLPATDLAWIDHLDDDALSRAEDWLARAGTGKKG